MSFLKRLGGRLPDFGDVVRRFPLTTLIMAAFTFWLIYRNFQSWDGDDQYIFGAFILAGYVSVIIRLIGEVRDWAVLKTLLAQIALAAISFTLAAFGKTLGFNIPMAVAAAILFLGNASLWRLSRNDMRVWNFTQKLWTGAIFATVGSLIFVAGVFAITSAVNILFDIRIDNLTEDIIIPIGLGFLAPLYWLGTLPSTKAPEGIEALSFEARALSFLGTWMLAPLLCIYSLIVLTYGVKILIQWELPKGEIASLVTPYLGIGMLVWLMLTPEMLNKNAFVRFYRKLWHWVMLPAAILLGTAVIVRVREYGFTVERVFLLLVFIWAMVQGLWFTILPAIKRDIRVPTALAAGLLVIGAAGAEWLSVRSQFNRAMEAKRELPIFTAETLRANSEIAKQFRGGVEYMIKTEREKQFKILLPDYDMPDYLYSDDWRKIKAELGLDEPDDIEPYRIAYSLKPAGPLTLAAGSTFYGPYNLDLSAGVRHHNKGSVIVGGRDFNVTLAVDGRRYNIDFEPIFEGLELKGGDDAEESIAVPVQTLLDDAGSPAQLWILSGYMAYYRDEGLRDANIAVAIIIPN